MRLRRLEVWVDEAGWAGDEATLVTCSSDTTIKLWNVTHQKCLATLTEHTDYVKALAYASQRCAAIRCLASSPPHRVHAGRLCARPCLGGEALWQGAAVLIVSQSSWSLRRRQTRWGVPRTCTACRRAPFPGVFAASVAGHRGLTDGDAGASGNREMLASAGLDREVMIWDVEAARAVASMPSPGPPGDITFMKASGHRDSIYCLAINSGGSVVVSGSTERVSSHAIGLLRLWDPRTAQKVLLAPSAVSPAPLCVCVLDS